MKRTRLTHEPAHGNKRSDKWPAFRKKFLKGKVCAACGGTKKLEAHHIRPFHVNPKDELKKSNIMPLCEGNKDINCHLVIGHRFNFKGWNFNARFDAAKLLQGKKCNKKLIERMSKRMKILVKKMKEARKAQSA